MLMKLILAYICYVLFDILVIQLPVLSSFCRKHIGCYLGIMPDIQKKTLLKPDTHVHVINMCVMHKF